MATKACNSESSSFLDMDVIRGCFLDRPHDENTVPVKPPLLDAPVPCALSKPLESNKALRRGSDNGNGSPKGLSVPQRLFAGSNTSTPAAERCSPVARRPPLCIPSEFNQSMGLFGARCQTPSSSVSSFRMTNTARLGVLPKAPNTTVMRPPSTMPSNGFSQYAFDIAKTLKEVVHSRDEALFLRVLPKAHLLNQLIFQETCTREQLLLQEASARMIIQHRCAEDRAKKEEQQLIRRSKERQEELKRRHAEELAEQKNAVMRHNSTLEQGLRERFKLLVQLQPRLNLINVAFATLKDESNDLSLIAELLEEAKKLQKALKTDARFNKTSTPELDGGALPYWLKHCVAASFNVAAILKGLPCRATVQDAPNIPSKLFSDRKIIVLRQTGLLGEVSAWVHTRVALPNVVAAAEGFLEFAKCDAGVPAELCQGVLWTKEDCASVVRAAKGANSTIAPLDPVSKSTLSFGGVASAELTMKDVKAIGEAASV